jgi:predicted phosphohydrolase
MEDGYDPRPMYTLVESLNTLKILLPNLRILNRELFIIDDVCIAGCTLWSRPYVNPYIVRIHGMNYRKYAHLHKTDLNFIENAMQFAKAKSLKLIVVSHYCPSLSLLKKIKPNDRFWSLYASNLDHLLTSKSVHTWIYGHTHFNCDVITEGGTRVVSNQRGKKKDNIRTFALDKVIEV